MVKIRFIQVDYEIAVPIITIGSVTFDVRKAEEWKNQNILSEEGELSRLYLDILGHPQTQITQDGKTFIIPAVQGIDLATATFAEIVDYLNVPIRIMPESFKELCRKIMAIRFPTDFNNEINLVSNKLKTEYQLIKAQINNEPNKIKILGQCGGGVLGKVRLDGLTDRIPRRIL